MEFIVVSEQLTYTLYSAAFGIAASMLYSIIKILRMMVGIYGKKEKRLGILSFLDRFRRKRPCRKKVVSEILYIHIVDILYFIFLAASFCIFVFIFNHGRIRWYLLMSVVIGFLTWYYSLGKLLMCVSEYIVYIIKSFTNLIIYVIMSPVRWIAKPFISLGNRINLKLRHFRELKKLKKYIFEG